MKEEIAKLLKNAVEEATGLQIEPEISASADASQGDYTSNIAMTIFANLKSQTSNFKSPKELAEKIVKHLTLDI